MTTPADPTPAATPEPLPAPAAVAPAASDTLAELSAIVAALRDQVASMKAVPAPTPALVPPTDHGKPTITPITVDPSSLPPIARMAAGYRK